MPANKEFNLMLFYLLHMIIRVKRTEWAASQVLQDHMAMGRGGVWAVVSFSVPLFGVKGLEGEGGGLYVHQNTFSLSKHTHIDTPPYVQAQNHITSVIEVPPIIQTSLIHYVWMRNLILRRKK